MTAGSSIPFANAHKQFYTAHIIFKLMQQYKLCTRIHSKLIFIDGTPATMFMKFINIFFMFYQAYEKLYCNLFTEIKRKIFYF